MEIRRKNINIIILPLLFLYLFLVYDVDFKGPDMHSYFSYTASLVEDGDLNIINQSNQLSNYGKFVSKTYNMPSIRDCGGVVLWLPFYIYAKIVYFVADEFKLTFLTVYSFDTVVKCVMSLSTVIFAFLAMLLTYKFCRIFFPSRDSLSSVLVLALGSPYLYYALFEVGNVNIMASLFCIILIWFGSYILTMNRFYIFLLGVFFSICIAVKSDFLFQSVYILEIFIIFFLQKRKDKAVCFIFGFLSVFLLGAVNAYLMNGILFTKKAFFLFPIAHFRYIYLFGGPFDYYGGIFSSSPVILVCVFSFFYVVMGLMKKTDDIKNSGKLQDVYFVILSGYLCIKILFIGGFFSYGSDLPVRLLLLDFPVFVLLYARLMQIRKNYLKRLLQSGALLLISWNLLHISGYMAQLDFYYFIPDVSLFAKIHTLKNISYVLFNFKDLGLKLKTCLPLLLIILMVLIRQNLKPVKDAHVPHAFWRVS